VLGCTHYPFLASVIRMRVEERTYLVDPAIETAKTVVATLAAASLSAARRGAHRLLATGDTSSLERINQRCFGGRLPTPERIAPVGEEVLSADDADARR